MEGQLPEGVPLKVEDVAAYVADTNIPTLVTEYSGIPRMYDPSNTWDVATDQTNVDKNRWPGFFAYDHSRVILQCRNAGTDESDYINASDIPDYRGKKKCFIVTQGPLPTTIHDFWRLVWQEKSNRIIMLANLADNGKVACERYWPGFGKWTVYGAVKVSFSASEVREEYVKRTFVVSVRNQTREVLQFHFTGWPDHGVPTSTAKVLRFWQAIHAGRGDITGPVITHCSAGVGRSGTFLAIHEGLRQAREQGRVDVNGYVRLMRKYRILMVQSPEQYVFVYKAINHALSTPGFLSFSNKVKFEEGSTRGWRQLVGNVCQQSGDP